MINKKLSFLAAGAVLTAGTWVAAQANFFNLPLAFGEGKHILQTFRQHAPADTLYYLETNMDQAAFLQASNVQMLATQMETTLAQLESIDQVSDAPGFQFFNYLLRDFVEQAKRGSDALIAHYGLGETMAAAFYMDGLAPVLQLAIADREAFIKVIDAASAASGLAYQQESWNGKPVRVWKTPEIDTDSPPLAVAIAFAKDNVAISLVRQDEDMTRKMQRLGLAPEPRSVADSRAVEHLKQIHDYSDTMVGYINFVEIAKTLLRPNQTGAGKDLLAIDSDYKPQWNEHCASEMVALAQTMPRLVFGYDRFDFKEGLLDLSGSAVLEVTNQDVISEIKKLNGHLAPHVTRYDDKLLAFGIGLNMTALSPVLTRLGNQFVQAQFHCPQLQMAQEQVKSANPGMLAMATAMLQSVKGMGISLYDLALGDLIDGQFKADVLLSVTAESPETLAALLSNVPGMQGVMAPTDGSAVALDLPLPVAVKPQIALKGKNLLVFTGEKSAAAAHESAKDTINSRGFLAYSGDYQRIGELLENAISGTGRLVSMDTDTCIEIYSSLKSLTAMDVQFSAVDAVTDKGIEFRMDSKWNTTAMGSKGFNPGNYRIEQMTKSCQWQPTGFEHIHADGNGGFRVRDKIDRCDIYVVDYKWQKKGARLTFNETKSMNRAGCADEWVAQDPTAYSCIITNESDDGFTCLFTSPELELYRYTLN